MEDYAKNVIQSKTLEKHEEGKESLDRYKKCKLLHSQKIRKLTVGTAIQPVMLYFASARKCCEELLTDVAEEKGKSSNRERQETVDSANQNNEGTEQKKKKNKGKGKKNKGKKNMGEKNWTLVWDEIFMWVWPSEIIVSSQILM